MLFTFPCPQCGKKLKAERYQVGKRAVCGQCETEVVIPPFKSEKPEPDVVPAQMTSSPTNVTKDAIPYETQAAMYLAGFALALQLIHPPAISLLASTIMGLISSTAGLCFAFLGFRYARKARSEGHTDALTCTAWVANFFLLIWEPLNLAAILYTLFAGQGGGLGGLSLPGMDGLMDQIKQNNKEIEKLLK